MKLEELKKEIPFKWRLQSIKWGKASCVAYINARDVQDLLDKVCGAANWQCKYSEHKGNLFCSIGIYAEDGFIWKADCGTESNVEKQKGEASDAFKRAAVMWGVGRFLYSKTIIKLDVMKDEKGKEQPSFNGKILYGDRISDACNHLSKK